MSWLAIQNWLRPGKTATDSSDEYAARRRRMVEEQLRRRGIRDLRVLEAMGAVPRHLFVGAGFQRAAYRDSALPIGHAQTISQPYVVALMTEAARIEPGDKALEVGTGSGYAAAVLSRIAGEVYTVERNRELADLARDRLRELAFENVRVIHGDGSEGWPAEAPYDAIIVTAAAPDLPQPLLDQLVDGGRLIVPVGDRSCQTLICATRRRDKTRRESLTEVRFVPLLGEYGWASH